MSKLEIFNEKFNKLISDGRFINKKLKITNTFIERRNDWEITVENIENCLYSKINIDEKSLEKFETEKDIDIFIYRILLSATMYVFSE